MNKKKREKNSNLSEPTRNLSYEAQHATNYLLLQRFNQRVMDQN